MTVILAGEGAPVQFDVPPRLGSGLDAGPIAERLGGQPGVQKVPGPKLTLFICRGFLEPELCAAVIERIDAVRRPSTIADPNGDAAYRTSETGDLDARDPVVLEVEPRIATMTGLDPAYGEPIQGQRYAVGQEFKGHTDHFEPMGADFDRYCAVAGGGTRFKAIDKTVRPETGKLLAWNNRRPDRSLNPATLHHGMKVRAGVKYVVTKWYRERPWA